MKLLSVVYCIEHVSNETILVQGSIQTAIVSLFEHWVCFRNIKFSLRAVAQHETPECLALFSATRISEMRNKDNFGLSDAASFLIGDREGTYVPANAQ